MYVSVSLFRFKSLQIASSRFKSLQIASNRFKSLGIATNLRSIENKIIFEKRNLNLLQLDKWISEKQVNMYVTKSRCHPSEGYDFGNTVFLRIAK